MKNLQYPIGKADVPSAPISSDQYERWIHTIETLPLRLELTVLPLSDAQLDTPYRPGGWTVRQLVHHIPDSHLNAYVRCKWILTEGGGALKAYDQDKWADLQDSVLTPVSVSLDFLKALHQRWVVLLRAASEEDMHKSIFHPEDQIDLTLPKIAALYAWHGDHHLAHIAGLVSRSGW